MTYQSIPEKEVRIIPLGSNEDAPFHEYIKRAHVTRDWFDAHVYKCLPLAIANQYGFILHSPFDFSFMWTGGGEPHAVQIKINDRSADPQASRIITVKNTFGRGIVTIYPGFVLKTAENISLWIKQPPNHIKENVMWLEGLVETDNLNSTFSFNMRVHDPNRWVHIKRGEPIGCFIPYPRFFVDDYKLTVSSDEDEVLYYAKKNTVFGGVRQNQIENGMYRKGQDFDGCPFHNHQVVVNKPKTKED